MLVVRFQRVGRKNDPAFRVVVTEKRSKPKSGELEILGSYHPKTKHTVLQSGRILYWMSKGAQASPTVHNLLVKHGVIKGKKVGVTRAVSAETKEKVTPVVEKISEESADKPVGGSSGEEVSEKEVPAATSATT